MDVVYFSVKIGIVGRVFLLGQTIEFGASFFVDQALVFPGRRRHECAFVRKGLCSGWVCGLILYRQELRSMRFRLGHAAAEVGRLGQPCVYLGT